MRGLLAREQLERVPERGLRASIAASISRFKPIASERAAIIANVIQTRSCAEGIFLTQSRAPT